MRKLIELLEEPPAGSQAGSDAPYKSWIIGVCGSLSALARIVDEDPLIICESPSVRELCGDNRNRSCFAFWEADEFCPDCIALAAMEKGGSCRKVVPNSRFGPLEARCIPVRLPDDCAAAVEWFIPAGSGRTSRPQDPKATLNPCR